jgi:diaminopimelate decarboxylase
MFTSNNTTPEEFDEASGNGGCILNLDDEIFINKIKMPKLISFRLNPGTRKTGKGVNDIIGDPVNSKYGVPIERIVDVYMQAREKGATETGLHTMICSNDLDWTNMARTIDLVLEVAGSLCENSLGPKFINLGGGVGIPYRPGEKEFDMMSLAQYARKALDGFEEKYHYQPKIYMESGRYVTGPSGVLVNPVINVYEKYKKFVGVSVAMPALMRVGMYSSAYHPCEILDKNFVPKNSEEYDLEKRTIAGPICENCDVLAKDMMLPNVKEGDYVVTKGTGAHGSAMAFTYNGRPRPQELLLTRNGTVRRIVRAETVEDLWLRHELVSTEENTLRL